MLAGGASNVGEIHLELNQPNQDNFLLNDSHQIYAVFDGHGDNGHDIAAFLKENLPITFAKALHSSSSVADSLRHTFLSLDETICKSTDSESSGSTCAIAYVTDDTLYTAGVGDCTALLAQVDHTSKEIKTTLLLPIHKLSNLGELARISKAGAAVDGEYIVCKTDPQKVINMTRSLGDQDMKSAGIISQPEISITKLPFSSSPKNKALRRLSVEVKDNEVTVKSENGNEPSSDSPGPDGADNNKDDVRFFDKLFTSENHENFLILTSDGLDQVSQKELAKQAYSLLKEHASTSNSNLNMDELCAKLLQKLEDDLYDRDGIGFCDDATVIVVPLSGFSSS